MIARIVTSIRRNAIAWLALFVALTGTSMAAQHYVITSKNQIKPSVLKRLHGKKGAQGAQGPAGGAGPAGKEGPQGPQGINGKSVTGPTGPKGATGAEGPQGPGVGATGPEGKEGKVGTTGPEGKEGKEGKEGTGGGGAKAWAHVTAIGGVSKAHNIVAEDVKLAPGEEGVYCISKLASTPENVVATVDGAEIAEVPLSATVHLGVVPGTKCPGETQITVETWEPGIQEKPLEIYAETINQGFFLLVN